MFSFFKKPKESSCSCGGTATQELKESDVMVFGACCKKSQESFANTQEAVKELGLDVEAVNIGDNALIAQYGVMQTPALYIKGNIISEGTLVSKDDALKALKENY